jgi:hypothetical protein
MAGHRRTARKHSDEVVSEPAPKQRGDRALGDVEHGHAEPELEAERAPDVGGARVPAPERADVHSREQARQPVPPRHRAEDVAERNEEEFAAQVWIWYFDTHLEMTSQSRFAKNASM